MLPLCHYCGIVALVWAGGWQLLLEWALSILVLRSNNAIGQENPKSFSSLAQARDAPAFMTINGCLLMAN